MISRQVNDGNSEEDGGNLARLRTPQQSKFRGIRLASSCTSSSIHGKFGLLYLLCSFLH